MEAEETRHERREDERTEQGRSETHPAHFDHEERPETGIFDPPKKSVNPFVEKESSMILQATDFDAAFENRIDSQTQNATRESHDNDSSRTLESIRSIAHV